MDELSKSVIEIGDPGTIPGFQSQMGTPRGRVQEMRNILASDFGEVGDKVPGANEKRALSSVREKLAAVIEAIWQDEA